MTIEPPVAPGEKKKRSHKSKAQQAERERRAAIKRGEAPPLGFTDDEEPEPADAKKGAPKRPTKKIAELRNGVVSMIALAASGLDGLAHTVAAKAWTDEDRLTETEVSIIAGAVAEEIIRRPKIAERIAGLANTRDRATLLLALALVAIPRLARHGALPPAVGRAVVQAMGGDPNTIRPAAPKPSANGQPARAAGSAPPPSPLSRDVVDDEPAREPAPMPPSGKTLDTLSGT